MRPHDQPDDCYLRAAARELRPRPWLRVHLPLLMPCIDSDRTQWLVLDAGDGCAITLRVQPGNVPRSICYFAQIERLLAPDQAAMDPVEPLADVLLRLSRGD